MDNTEDRDQTITVDKIADFLSGLGSGGADGRLLEGVGDELLKPIIDEVNALAGRLQTMEQRAAAVNSLLNQSADAIMTITPPSWKFTGCNPAALKLFEVSDETTFTGLGYGRYNHLI